MADSKIKILAVEPDMYVAEVGESVILKLGPRWVQAGGEDTSEGRHEAWQWLVLFWFVMHTHMHTGRMCKALAHLQLMSRGLCSVAVVQQQDKVSTSSAPTLLLLLLQV